MPLEATEIWIPKVKIAKVLTWGTFAANASAYFRARRAGYSHPFLGRPHLEKN